MCGCRQGLVQLPRRSCPARWSETLVEPGRSHGLETEIQGGRGSVGGASPLPGALPGDGAEAAPGPPWVLTEGKAQARCSGPPFSRCPLAEHAHSHAPVTLRVAGEPAGGPEHCPSTALLHCPCPAVAWQATWGWGLLGSPSSSWLPRRCPSGGEGKDSALLDQPTRSAQAVRPLCREVAASAHCEHTGPERWTHPPWPHCRTCPGRVHSTNVSPSPGLPGAWGCQVTPRTSCFSCPREPLETVLPEATLQPRHGHSWQWGSDGTCGRPAVSMGVLCDSAFRPTADPPAHSRPPGAQQADLPGHRSSGCHRNVITGQKQRMRRYCI